MRVSFAPFADEDPHGATSILTALGSALFCPAILSGILFLIGLALANWRHAVIAVLGASIAVGLAVTVHVPGGMINSGFVGFNAVLAAVAAYALVSPDLRLVVLAAGLSTWVFVVFVTTSQDPALASGYVVAIWAIMALGWLNSRFTNAESVSDSD
jgi:urea transporter